MSDPRPAQRALYADWLRVRARVRALAASIAAAQHTQTQNAKRVDDGEQAELTAQLHAQRDALEKLGSELDARIAALKRDFTAIECAHVETLVARATGMHGTRKLPIRGAHADLPVATARLDTVIDQFAHRSGRKP